MSRDGLLTVAEVSRRTGASRKALRLYEDLGLVEPTARTEAGYRLYDEAALAGIERVRRAQLLEVTVAFGRAPGREPEGLDVLGGVPGRRAGRPPGRGTSPLCLTSLRRDLQWERASTSRHHHG